MRLARIVLLLLVPLAPGLLGCARNAGLPPKGYGVTNSSGYRGGDSDLTPRYNPRNFPDTGHRGG